MSNFKSRADFLRNNPSASAFAALADATKQQKNVTDSAIKLKPGQLAGKKVGGDWLRGWWFNCGV